MSTFDEMRDALLEKNIALNCGYESKKIDYEYLFDQWSRVNKASGMENECSKHMSELNGMETETMPLNLVWSHLVEPLLSAFGNLSLEKRLRYTMILLYCADPKRCFENDQISLDDIALLYAMKLIDLPDSGMLTTTKEGVYFLYRFFLSNNLKAEFK